MIWIVVVGFIILYIVCVLIGIIGTRNERIQQMKIEIADLSDIISEKNSVIRKSNEKLEDLWGKNDILKSEKEQLEVENAGLLGKIVDMTRENERLKERVIIER